MEYYRRVGFSADVGECREESPGIGDDGKAEWPIVRTVDWCACWDDGAAREPSGSSGAIQVVDVMIAVLGLLVVGFAVSVIWQRL